MPNNGSAAHDHGAVLESLDQLLATRKNKRTAHLRGATYAVGRKRGLYLASGLHGFAGIPKTSTTTYPPRVWFRAGGILQPATGKPRISRWSRAWTHKLACRVNQTTILAFSGIRFLPMCFRAPVRHCDGNRPKRRMMTRVLVGPLVQIRRFRERFEFQHRRWAFVWSASDSEMLQWQINKHALDWQPILVESVFQNMAANTACFGICRKTRGPLPRNKIARELIEQNQKRQAATRNVSQSRQPPREKRIPPAGREAFANKFVGGIAETTARGDCP